MAPFVGLLHLFLNIIENKLSSSAGTTAASFAAAFAATFAAAAFLSSTSALMHARRLDMCMDSGPHAFGSAPAGFGDIGSCLAR
jgi:hypothetical protein